MGHEETAKARPGAGSLPPVPPPRLPPPHHAAASRVGLARFLIIVGALSTSLVMLIAVAQGPSLSTKGRFSPIVVRGAEEGEGESEWVDKWAELNGFATPHRKQGDDSGAGAGQGVSQRLKSWGRLRAPSGVQGGGAGEGSRREQEGAACPECLECPSAPAGNELGAAIHCPDPKQWDHRSRDPEKNGEMAAAFAAFDFQPFMTKEQVAVSDIARLNKLLEPFLARDPPAPASVLSRPGGPLSQHLDCGAEEFKEALTGKPRGKEVRVFDFIPFNSELDLLEMRLHELNETVDLFVVLESVRTHKGTPKALFYAAAANRFEAFHHKIMHLVGDDADYWGLREGLESTGHLKDGWRIEVMMRELLWNRFVAAHGMPGEDDVLIQADLDEIPSGRSVYHLRHCEPRSMPLASKAIFHQFSFAHAFKSDWPAKKELQYTLRFPLFGNRRHLKQDGEDHLGMLRRKGYQCGKLGGTCSFPSLPGGVHMSWKADFAYIFYKLVSVAEGGTLGERHRYMIEIARSGKFDKFYEDLAAGGRAFHADWARRIVPTKTLASKSREYRATAPWFAEANRDRFPRFFIGE